MGETVESSRLDENPNSNSRRTLKNGSGSSGSSGTSMQLPNGCNSLDENSAEAKEKKGSFQITRVISRSGEGGDKAWLDDPGSDLAAANNVDIDYAVFLSMKEAADRLRRAKDPQSRFRLVKIETEAGVRHGRWHCLDFSDCAASGGALELLRSASTLDNFVGTGGTYDDVETSAECVRPTSSAGQFVGNVASEAMGQGNADCTSAILDDPSTVNWILRSPGSLPVDPVSPSAAFLSSTFDTIVEKELFRALPSFDSEFLGNGDFASSFPLFHESFFTNRARKPSDTNEEGLDYGGASTVAIDNKIEQAMDLVKSHLMFAVREEVEQLKVKIQELSDRNARLEYENMVLRESAPQETLTKLQHSAPLLPS